MHSKFFEGFMRAPYAWAAAGLAAGACYATVFVVPAGHVGVETLFGRVNLEYYNAGLHASNPFSRVRLYDTRVRNTELGCQSATADGMALASSFTVRWRLAPEHTVSARHTVAGDVEDAILRPLLVDAAVHATSRFGVSATFADTTRMEIGRTVAATLAEKCAPYGLVVLDVMVNQLKPPESVERAVHLKMTAEQEAERANYVRDRQRIELAFATETAQFEAERNLMLARAEAERLRLLAASEAERMLLLADADARRREFEARAVRVFQDAVNASTSARVIEWRKIEAAQALFTNPNVKFAFVDPKQPMLLDLKI